MSRHICFECGKQLVKTGSRLIFKEIDYHGTKVKMHIDCAKRQEKELTVKTPVIGKRIDE